jgi:hypothetical protein
MDKRLVGPVPSWMLQAWGLWKADILILSDMCGAAASQAAQTLEEYDYELQSSAFAGPFARWLSRTASSDVTRERAQAIVGGMMRRLQTFDELDQVEILCSWDLLTGEDPESAAIKGLQDKLRRLPQSIAGQLKRQGFLRECLDILGASKSRRPSPDQLVPFEGGTTPGNP